MSIFEKECNYMEDKRVFSIAVCDDDNSYIELMKSHIDRYFSGEGINYAFYRFNSGEELMKACGNGEFEEIHLLFLDVEMPGISGLELKQQLSNVDVIKRIVFSTSHEEAMPMAFGFKVIGFHKKPLEYEQVSKWIKVVGEELRYNVDITYEDGKNIFITKLLDIECIKADKDYTLIYTTTGEVNRISQSMKYWESKLKGSLMMRVHRSYFANLEQILSVDEEITLRSNMKVPIGRKYRKEIMKEHQEYTLKKMRNRVL